MEFLPYKSKYVGEVSDAQLVIIMRNAFNIKTINIPSGVLMIVAAYAQPWYGDTAFRFGGCDFTHGERLSTSIQFDIKENKWITLADMNFPRDEATAVIYPETSQIFVCGGSVDVTGPRTRLSTMECYSIMNNTWMTMPSMRCARSGHTSVEFKGLIFIIGGCDNAADVTSSCEVFNISENTWSDLPNMSIGRENHSSAVDSYTNTATAYIYAIGGYKEKTVERYNITLRKWDRVTDLSQWRSGHGSVILQSPINSFSERIVVTIIVIGGEMEDYLTASIEQYIVNDNDDNDHDHGHGQWITSLWSLPEPRTLFSTHLISNNVLLLCGGWNNHGPLSSCLHINLRYSEIVENMWECNNIRFCYRNLPIPCLEAAAC